MVDLTLFFDLGVIVIAAALVASVARLLKQPLIPAYILTGIILVPLVNTILPGVVQLSAASLDLLQVLAEIGIAFLLFTVGLDFNFKRLRAVGGVATLGALAGFVLVFFIAYAAALALGFLSLQAAYFGLILSFSSTLVVVKLLADKKELETLQGRIIIGILLMQDILAVLALTILNTLNDFSVLSLLGTLQKGVILLILALLLGKFVFPRVFRFAARNQELLFVLSLAVCFLFALLFAWIGFSIAIGAFIGGIILANLPYNLEIGSKVKPLKDFFLVLFFVSIGAQFVGFSFTHTIGILLVLLFIVLVLKPVILMAMTGFFGYKKRVAGVVGVNLGQVSEFSIIIAMTGLTLGHITRDMYSMTIFLSLISIAATTYAIKYDRWVYDHILKHVPFFQHKRRELEDLEQLPAEAMQPRILLIGADRTGYGILETLEKLKKPYLVVDFNPDVVRKLRSKKVPCLYGDVSDNEVFDRISLQQVELIISTVPDTQENLHLIKRIQRAHAPSHLILTANTVQDALDLYEAGAHYVVIPHHLGGQHVSRVLEEHALDLDNLVSRKVQHMKELHLRMDAHSPPYGSLGSKETG